MRRDAIIFTAPSGGGKTTLVRHLLNRFPQLTFSVSATTRPKREHETDGVDYHFLSLESFLQLRETDSFLEWEEVYPGRFYGTLKSEAERAEKEGKIILFDVDVMGALRLERKLPGSLSVFVCPPSLQVLFQRLEARSTESPESLQSRKDRASLEMSYANKFDYILVNDALPVALQEAESLVLSFISADPLK